MILIHKSHKIQLLPNDTQKVEFVKYAGAHRFAYNFGLESKQTEYKNTNKTSGAYILATKITIMKYSTHTWLSGVPKSIPRLALQQLDFAYTNFFRRVKNKSGKPGFPRFKSRKQDRLVFHLETGTIALDNNKVRIPKLGWVRMCQSLRFQGKLVGTVAISEQAGKWYASFTVEVETQNPCDNQVREVGIDLGVKTLATTSDGCKFENPKHGQHLEKLLAQAQRQLARKEVGSKRRQKAKLRVQRIYKRIADKRNDTINQATSRICKKYNIVYLEDLNISGMMQNHHLAGAVADASMREFVR
jgi:putative transposase